MNKLKKSIIVLGLAATAICGISLSISNSSSTEVSAYFTPTETYQNHDADTYYNSIDESLSGTDLLSALRGLNSSRRKKTMGYKTGGTDATNSDFIYTDYDTSDPSTIHTDSKGQTYGTVISSFYSYTPCTSFNKEHVWPNTHGGNKVEADIHMARPTIQAENSSRGHSYYVDGMVSKNNTGWDPYEAFKSTYGEKCKDSRGESARIIFYCMVASDQLVLEVGHSDSSKTSNNKMGDLVDILKWSVETSVTEREMNRNEGAEYLQGNRNPFIDHPEYACKIWGNTNDATRKICQSTPPTPTKTLTDLSVSGTPTKKNYIVGESFNSNGLTVTAKFSDDSESNVTSSVTWSTLELGDTSVTGTYVYDGVSKQVEVTGITVSAAEKTLSSLSKSGTLLKTNYVEGDDFDPSGLTITANYSDGSNLDVTDKVLWPSLEVGATFVTGTYTEGNVTKTVTINGITVSKKVIAVESVKISDCVKEQVVGNQVKLNVSITPENADDKTLCFRSSDESIATVSNDGLVKFFKEGFVEITVSSSNGKTDSVKFTVTSKPSEFISIEDMFLNYTSFTLDKGATKQLVANITPENATNKKVYWSSSDELIAKVDSNGLVTAFGGGEAVITATTEDGGFTATCTVTVNAPKPILAEIAVMRAPYKSVYNPNDQFERNGLVVEAHYADGNEVDITDACTLSVPDMSTEGEKEIEVCYILGEKAYKTKFVISVVSSPIISLNISKFPAKTHYFASEHFSPIGLVVNAVCQNNSVISNVTSRAQFLYNFEKSPSVTVVVGTVSVSFNITLETGTITDQHKAADFTYVFDDKLVDVNKENVTLAQWTILEYNFNKLDENAKKVLRETSSKQNGGEVSAAEDVSLNLKNCVAKYDEIYLAHSADGFNDFMNRSPKAETSPVNWPLIIGIAAGVVLLIVLIIVISVTASKKRSKKHA